MKLNNLLINLGDGYWLGQVTKRVVIALTLELRDSHLPGDVTAICCLGRDLSLSSFVVINGADVSNEDSLYLAFKRVVK